MQAVWGCGPAHTQCVSRDPAATTSLPTASPALSPPFAAALFSQLGGGLSWREGGPGPEEALGLKVPESRPKQSVSKNHSGLGTALLPGLPGRKCFWEHRSCPERPAHGCPVSRWASVSPPGKWSCCPCWQICSRPTDQEEAGSRPQLMQQIWGRVPRLLRFEGHAMSWGRIRTQVC